MAFNKLEHTHLISLYAGSRSSHLYGLTGDGVAMYVTQVYIDATCLGEAEMETNHALLADLCMASTGVLAEAWRIFFLFLLFSTRFEKFVTDLDVPTLIY